MNKITITGGAGFIGSHLTALLLQRGFAINVIDSLITGTVKNLSSLSGNLEVHTIALQDASIDQIAGILEGSSTLIPLAALADIVPSIVNPKQYFENNVSATVNLLEAVRKSNVKISGTKSHSHSLS